MKPYIRFFSVLPLLLCSGCMPAAETGSIPNAMDGAFTVQAQILSGDDESACTLTRMGQGAWRVEFSEPRSLSGVQLDFLDEEVTASYKGLAFSVPQSAQAVRTELSELMAAVDALSLSPTLEGHRTEEGIELTGDADAGGYTLTCSEEGIPMAFSLPSYALEIRLEGFSPSGGGEPGARSPGAGSGGFAPGEDFTSD